MQLIARNIISNGLINIHSVKNEYNNGPNSFTIPDCLTLYIYILIYVVSVMRLNRKYAGGSVNFRLLFFLRLLLLLQCDCVSCRRTQRRVGQGRVMLRHNIDREGGNKKEEEDSSQKDINVDRTNSVSLGKASMGIYVDRIDPSRIYIIYYNRRQYIYDIERNHSLPAGSSRPKA